MSSARVELTKEMTGTDLASVKVLMVGAGGIGCELVKNLVMTGFEDITMIDLDTIDYSNLNRQFLFRAKHVGRSKAEVARESAMEFPHGDRLVIDARHGNIKSNTFTFDFFKQFNIVLNGLDNVDARRHVNRVCLATGVPLVESGTEGYLGQARAIIKGQFKCYECDPPAVKKTHPVCTIRNHPDKPIHCIVWAKAPPPLPVSLHEFPRRLLAPPPHERAFAPRRHCDARAPLAVPAQELLFKKLFGGEETDLIDDSEEAGGEEGDAPPPAAEPAPASEKANGGGAAAPPLKLQQGEQVGAFARRVFRAVFQHDVERLLNMESLWKERRKPTPLRLDEMRLPEAKGLADKDQVAWSVAENAAVFVDCIERVFTHRADEVGALSFDKDDDGAPPPRRPNPHPPRPRRPRSAPAAPPLSPAPPRLAPWRPSPPCRAPRAARGADALDFVTAAANLRSEIFYISRQSRWKVKEDAGNIIPAIATTNAIIGGFIVLEALKVLRGATDRCKYMACNYYELTGRKRDRLLAPDALDAPNPRCYVCGSSSLALSLDTTKVTVGQLLDDVVKKHLSFNRPTVDYCNLEGNGDQLCEGQEDEVDEEEAAKYERYRALALSALPAPIGSGTELDVADTSQELSLKIQVVHAVLDEEKAPQGFLLSGDADAAKAAAVCPPADDPPPASAPSAPGVAGDDDVQIVDPPTDLAASKKKLRFDEPGVLDDDDDCVMLE